MWRLFRSFASHHSSMLAHRCGNSALAELLAMKQKNPLPAARWLLSLSLFQRVIISILAASESALLFRDFQTLLTQ